MQAILGEVNCDKCGKKMKKGTGGDNCGGGGDYQVGL